MPDINVDINVPIEELLRFAPDDEVLDYLKDETSQEYILEQLDEDAVKEYALRNLGLIEE
jgi:hypothetical protein